MNRVGLLGPAQGSSTRNAALNNARRHPRAFLATDAGHKLELPFAPTEAELGGVAHLYAIVPRPGRKALVLPDGPDLRTLAFDIIVAHGDHQQSIEPILHQLRDIARRAHRITVGNLGHDAASNAWRLRDYRQRVRLRQHGSNLATRAGVSLEFVEASDLVVNVGPMTGGALGPPAVAPPAASVSAPDRHYTVVKGDTLWGIAVRHYGNGEKWRAVADLNGVRDPRKLAVGAVLRLPVTL